MFAMHLRPEVLKQLREEYPKGTRVELIEMNDPYREMPPGLKGTVQMVDDAGGIQINWDNGSTLAAIHGFDRIRKIDDKQKGEPVPDSVEFDKRHGDTKATRLPSSYAQYRPIPSFCQSSQIHFQ